MKVVNTLPLFQLEVALHDQPALLRIDTGARDNFLSVKKWNELRSLTFQPPKNRLLITRRKNFTFSSAKHTTSTTTWWEK